MKVKIIGVEEVTFKSKEGKDINVLKLFCARTGYKVKGLKPLEKPFYVGRKKFDIEFDEADVLVDAHVNIDFNNEGKIEGVHFD